MASRRCVIMGRTPLPWPRKWRGPRLRSRRHIRLTKAEIDHLVAATAAKRQKLEPWGGPESYTPTFSMFVRKGSIRAV